MNFNVNGDIMLCFKKESKKKKLRAFKLSMALDMVWDAKAMRLYENFQSRLECNSID